MLCSILKLPLIRTGAILTLFVCASVSASAATIEFIGPLTTVNDGTYNVLPYQVTINGASQQVICFDVLDNVYAGNIWQAGILTLTEAAASGFFTAPDLVADYERVAWLSVQPYSDAAEQVGLQHAIWNVFGSVSETPESLSYEAAADAAAASGYSGFNFSDFRFIQQVGAVQGSPGTYQAFVYDTATNGSSGQAPQAPEPGTISLISIGLLLAGFGAWRRSTRHHNP
jgi:hypothetical protein